MWYKHKKGKNNLCQLLIRGISRGIFKIMWLKMKGNMGIFSKRVDKKGLKFDLAMRGGEA